MNKLLLAKKNKDKYPNPYDIHFYFDSSHTSDMIGAIDIMKRLKQLFPWLKMYEPYLKPVGPHPKPMWEADFIDCPDIETEFYKVLEWLNNEHKHYSVLIHPNTPDGNLLDHTQNAIWLGTPLKLDCSIFSD